MSATRIPIVLEYWVERLLAVSLAQKFSFLMTSITLSRVLLLIPSLLFMTRLTVLAETPAILAMS